MNTEIFDVEVEWLDGTVRTYRCGGYHSRECQNVTDGVLDLFLGNSAHGPLEHVASIPLDFVRTWRRKPGRSAL